MDDIQTLVDMGFEPGRVQYAMKVTDFAGASRALEWLLQHENEDLPAGALTTLGPKGQRPLMKCLCCGTMIKGQTDKVRHLIQTGHSRFMDLKKLKQAIKGQIVGNDNHTSSFDAKEKRRRLRQMDSFRKGLRDDAAMDCKEPRAIHSSRSVEDMCRCMDVKITKLQQRRRRLEQRRCERNGNRPVPVNTAGNAAAGGGGNESAAGSFGMTADSINGSFNGSTSGGNAACINNRRMRKMKSLRRRQSSEARFMDTSSIISLLPLPQEDSLAPNYLSQNQLKSNNSKDSKFTRLKVRLPDGKTITQIFHMKQKLNGVRAYIELSTGLEGPYKLISGFPRRELRLKDNQQTLEDLGLFPSAVLIVSKTKGNKTLK